MEQQSSNDVVMRLSSIDQLFNDPDINPFSEHDIDLHGEPGLKRAIRRMVARRRDDRHKARLVIELPPDQITPALQGEVSAAIRRYCTAKIDDNKLDVRISRVRNAILLVAVTIISLVTLALAYVIINFIIGSDSTLSAGLVAGLACVFVWVIMWDPIEALMFEWVQPGLESRVLRKVMEMDVIVRPQTQQ